MESPVWITGLSIAGLSMPVSQEGESAIRHIEVQPGQEHVQFDFTALSYSPGNVLRYQYRLGAEDWSAPIESRSVHYGALAPGEYQFAVRAVDSDGAVSPSPATVEFRVIPKLWSRTWFQAMLIALAIGAIVLIQRLRASRLLEIERLRSSIALDLHDDVASNLSQITIFSEIALREAGANSRAAEPLSRIADTARETVESINDLVWSMRPSKEGDLSQRVRRFGSDVLTARRIDVDFHIPDELQRLSLDPHARRQVYLIYKEAVHNAVKHAEPTSVAISLYMSDDSLVLNVRDNGKGMEKPQEGNGLPGMHTRAASLGGALAIRTAAGQGTEIELRVPLNPPKRFRILHG
jgi:signal transduction histidine kinase